MSGDVVSLDRGLPPLGRVTEAFPTLASELLKNSDGMSLALIDGFWGEGGSAHTLSIWMQTVGLYPSALFARVSGACLLECVCVYFPKVYFPKITFYN